MIQRPPESTRTYPLFTHTTLFRSRIARDERTAEEAAFERVGRTLKPKIFLRGREHDAGRRTRLDAAEHHHVAGAGPGIGALQAVEPDNLQPLILGIGRDDRSEEHTSELQSLMRISYAVFCLKKKKPLTKSTTTYTT